jgi:REase_DpnII-MboI
MLDLTMNAAAIETRIATIRRTLLDANKASEEAMYTQDPDAVDYSGPVIEVAFNQLLLLAEIINLPALRQRVEKMFESAQGKMGETRMGADEPYLFWGAQLSTVLDAIEPMVTGRNLVESPVVSLLSFLQESLYSITDKHCFAAAPSGEEDVHRRIEAALRCAHPDLKHKPVLTKPIKNFEPDTGLPSIRTLVEYKFVNSDEDAKRVADEILADTRGYEDPAWTQFFFVIYETRRFRSLAEWKGLLKQCGTADKAEVVVLCGEAPGDVKQRPSQRS